MLNSRLESHILSLHNQMEKGRLWSGATLLVIGGAYVAYGAASDNLTKGQRDTTIITGSVIGLLGGLNFILASHDEKMAEKYIALKSDTESEEIYRLGVGEMYLQSFMINLERNEW